MSINSNILDFQHRDVVLIRNIWTRILKSATSSLLFNQILYWSTEDKKGNSKLKVKKDGYYWIAKTYQQWEEEIYLPASTVRDAVNKLSKLGLISTHSYMFNGLKTLHIRVDWSAYSRLLQEEFDLNFPGEFRDAEIEEQAETQKVIPKAEKLPRKKEEVTLSTDDALKVLQVWNDNRESLPEAQSLSITREKSIQRCINQYGLDKTLVMMERATRVVSADDWWNGKNPQNKKYGIDSLFHNDKIVSKSENYGTDVIKSKATQKIDSYNASQELDY